MNTISHWPTTYGNGRIIVFIRYVRILMLLPCPRVTFYYVILEKRSYTREDTQLHTLISYVLLLIHIVIYVMNGAHCYAINPDDGFFYIFVQILVPTCSVLYTACVIESIHMKLCICICIRGARFNRLRRLIDCLPRIDSQSPGEMSNRLIAQ